MFIEYNSCFTTLRFPLPSLFEWERRPGNLIKRWKIGAETRPSDKSFPVLSRELEYRPLITAFVSQHLYACVHPSSPPKQTHPLLPHPHPCTHRLPLMGLKQKWFMLPQRNTPEKAAARCARRRASPKKALPDAEGFGQGNVLPPCPIPVLRPLLWVHRRRVNQPEKHPGNFPTALVMSFNPRCCLSGPPRRTLPSLLFLVSSRSVTALADN